MSIAPAPNPRGIANKHSHNILLEQEKPKRANAVTVVLIAVILAVPKRWIKFAENRLEVIVPPEIIIVIKLAYDTGRLSSV